MAAPPAGSFGRGGLLAGVDAAEADPLVQQGGALTGTGTKGEFGFSVALSADGETALVGEPGYRNHAGAAWVFTRTGETWTQQGETLSGVHAGESGQGEFGASVALSADGNTALIGASDDDEGAGAAWVFTREGETWSQQGGKLTGSGNNGDAAFGRGVALSADGGTALIGGPRENRHAGAAWVFTRIGGSWNEQDKLTTAGSEGSFGESVALSAEGDLALIGAPEEAGGAAWVFTSMGGSWNPLGERLTGAGEGIEAAFGRRVALSAEGDVALVGGPGESGGAGAAWMFSLAAGTWSQQGGKLTGNDHGKSNFGFGVALSGDGETALIGAPAADKLGAVYVLTREGETWVQSPRKLTAGGETAGGEFGRRIAMSASGDTALIGGPGNNHEAGAAWVFQATTEAHPHWYTNERMIEEGRSTSVVTKGTLHFTVGAASQIACKATDTETIENPVGHGAGSGKVTNFSLSHCKATAGPCGKGEKVGVVPGGLPWMTELLAGPPIRDSLPHVEFSVRCTDGAVTRTVDILTGTLTPEVGRSVLEFASGSGELGESIGGEATLTGEDSLKGPPKSQTITAETP
ncbi:MAG TPA: hypothetical protein VMI13_09310 [Solirubrobacteraceae bacterium]|nr:hypothetical protein [Solirubrobacteraceae bacterium]